MIDVNVRAVHILTKLMLRYFKERGTGYLLNVASSAGLFPAGPFMATYYATKAYVTSLTNYYKHVNYTHSLIVDNTHNATVYSSASGDVTVKN